MLCPKARAEILLTIDVVNPTNGSLSATSANPSENFSLELTGDTGKLIDGGSWSSAANGMTEPYSSLYTLDYARGIYNPGKDLDRYANAESFVASATSSGPIVGSYEVIPEPAACVLLGAAGMLLIFRRRRTY